MSEIIQLQSIADLHKLFNLGNSQHPLVAVLDFSQVSEQVNQNSKISTFIQLCLKTIVKQHQIWQKSNRFSRR
jgi:hypothetical protein